MNQFQKCSVVMLPTQKASKIHLVPAGKYESINGRLVKTKSPKLLFTPEATPYGYPPQHLYIINPKEKIKKDDWYLHIGNIPVIVKCSDIAFVNIPNVTKGKCFKIIASTDHDLYLPSPSLAFMKKFVNKDGNIKEVRVKYILKPISQFALKFLNPIYDYEIYLGLTPSSLQEKNIFHVKIEGKKSPFLPDPDIDGYELGKDIDFVPKINAQNYITIASTQYNFDYETLKNLFRKFETDLHQIRISDLAFENWLDNNL